MLMFKQFIKEYMTITGYNEILNEELNDDQKAVVDSWGANTKAKKISANVIPKGEDRTYIPLEHPDDNKPVEPHPDVKAHLEKHGYKITDYKGNKAVEPKYGREIRIGKALNATGASKDLMDTFNNDPKRAASNSGKLGVVISRHPHDVAGMSTDRGWRSCMKMGKTGNKKDYDAGQYSHYLKHDVKQGTHVAYLVHEHDKEAKQPLARIALKPFQSEDKKDTILRPEDRTYGTSDHAFGHTVKKWAETNFPAKEGNIYRKNTKLYDDDNKGTVASTNTLLKSKSYMDRADAFSNSDITHEHITQGLNDPIEEVRRAAVSHPNATKEHLSKVLDNPNEERHVRIGALLHPKLPSEEITKVLNSPGGYRNNTEKEYALKNPNVTQEHITQALNDSNRDIRKSAIQNSKVTLKPEHISKVLDNPNEDTQTKAIAVRRPEATAEHITKGLDHNNSYVRHFAIKNPNANEDHITKALYDPNADVRRSAIFHPKATSEHITKALNDNDEDVVQAAIKHPNATPEHITKALNHPSGFIRKDAIENPNSTEEHVNKALKDSSGMVVRAAETRLAQLRVADKKKSKEL